jgi:hypothetical protein
MFEFSRDWDKSWSAWIQTSTGCALKLAVRLKVIMRLGKNVALSLFLILPLCTLPIFCSICYILTKVLTDHIPRTAHNPRLSPRNRLSFDKRHSAWNSETQQKKPLLYILWLSKWMADGHGRWTAKIGPHPRHSAKLLTSETKFWEIYSVYLQFSCGLPRKIEIVKKKDQEMPCNFFGRVIVPDSIQIKPRPCPKAVLCALRNSRRRPSSEWQRNSSHSAVQIHPGRRFRATQGSRSEQNGDGRRRRWRPLRSTSGTVKPVDPANLPYITNGDIEKIHPDHRPIVRSIIS